MSNREKRFSGRHALLWFVVFFGVIAAVNGAMIWFALDSAPVEMSSAQDRETPWKS